MWAKLSSFFKQFIFMSNKTTDEMSKPELIALAVSLGLENKTNASKLTKPTLTAMIVAWEKKQTVSNTPTSPATTGSLGEHEGQEVISKTPKLVNGVPHTEIVVKGGITYVVKN